MRCEKCGNQNPRGARFCGYCQHELKRKTGFIPLVMFGILILAISAVVFFYIHAQASTPSNSRRISTTLAETVATEPEYIIETVHVHSWKSATCTAPQKCTVCGMESGDAKGHHWKSATCTTPQRCAVCGAESGVAKGHKWQPATYDWPQTCATCGTTTGSPLNPLSKYEVGDAFAFGSFEQDGSNGNGKEEIGWRILAKTSDKMLVVSEHGLDSRRYHNRNESVDWEDSSVRSWLNDDFYDSAFSSREKSYILTTSNSDTSTRDRIFLLSIDEVELYFSGKSDRICYATRYALYQDAYANNKTGGSWWLLRTAGKDSKHVMSVNSDGKIDYDGGKVASDRGVVRPAMWLDISN